VIVERLTYLHTIMLDQMLRRLRHCSKNIMNFAVERRYIFKDMLTVIYFSSDED